jgi:hypothetical protein
MARTTPRNGGDRPSQQNQKPVDSFSDGPVQVSIWENQSAKGAFRAATLQLRYKDGETGRRHRAMARMICFIWRQPPAKPGAGLPRGLHPKSSAASLALDKKPDFASKHSESRARATEAATVTISRAGPLSVWV